MRSRTRAVVRSHCCTSCCTALTLKRRIVEAVPGSVATVQWAQIRAAAPQVAARIQRYLQRLTVFLAPAGVDAAENALRQFTRRTIADAATGARPARHAQAGPARPSPGQVTSGSPAHHWLDGRLEVKTKIWPEHARAGVIGAWLSCRPW
jgi:hypothetical protein